MIISKANEDSWCLETPQCLCSKCDSEADFGSFIAADDPVNAISGSSKGLDLESPKIVNFPEGHRCKKFPCPYCHPGRSRRKDSMHKMLEQCPQSVPVVLYGDGDHTCRRFPCPICHNRRASLQVESWLKSKTATDDYCSR